MKVAPQIVAANFQYGLELDQINQNPQFFNFLGMVRFRWEGEHFQQL